MASSNPPSSGGRPGIDREDRVARVVNYLEKRIFSGDYETGDLLPAERELSTELGVSRSVVREALGKLDSLGLIHRRQGSGTRVAAPSNAPVLKGFQRLIRAGTIDLNDLTVARLPLEITMVRLAAANRSEEHVLQLEEQQAILAEEGHDVETHLAADVAFHAILAEASGNPMFAMLLEPIQHLRHDPYRQHYDTYQLHKAREEHAAILEAVRARNGDAAEQAMRAHLEKHINVSGEGKHSPGAE